MRRFPKPLAMTLAAIAPLWFAPVIAPQAYGAEGEQRAFTLSTDPEEVVLQARFSGGMLPSKVYTLYGDGRLVHEEVNQAAKSVSDRVEMHLDFLEGEELVRMVVAAGLLECDPNCIEQRCAQSLGLHRIARAQDCGGVTLTLNLETYQGPGESAPSSVQRRMYQHCPHDVAELCPDIEELEAVRQLGRALAEHKKAEQEAAP